MLDKSKVEDDVWHSMKFTVDKLGYSTRHGVDYLIREGHISEKDVLPKKRGQKGYKTIFIRGSAINKILEHPRYSRYSFKHNLRDWAE